jgi:aspartate/glutamate racemase
VKTIGGMSWESSTEYYRLINQETKGGVSADITTHAV